MRIRRWIVLATIAIPAPTFVQAPADEWLKKPVDDRTFKSYLDLFTYQQQLPFEPRTIGMEEQEGIKREHLSFQSTPGVRVFAHLSQPPGGSAKGNPAVIVLHGGSAGGKDAAGPTRVAGLIARGGWTVLAIDMQHWGERATGLFTTYTEQEKHDRLYNDRSAYLAWVAQTVKDVSRSYDFLVQERGADRKRVALLGISRGAIASSIAAAVERRIGAVVLWYGGHFDALERGHVPAACPANYVGRISPRPLLMLNGVYDTDMIKETSVEPLYRLAKEPKQILWTEGGHGSPSEENRAAALRWLRENLK